MSQKSPRSNFENDHPNLPFSSNQEDSGQYFIQNLTNLVHQNSRLQLERDKLKEEIQKFSQDREEKDEEIHRLKTGRKIFESTTITMANNLSDVNEELRRFKDDTQKLGVRLVQIEDHIDHAHTDAKHVQNVLKNEKAKLQTEVKYLSSQCQTLEQQLNQTQEAFQKEKTKIPPLLKEAELAKQKIGTLEKENSQLLLALKERDSSIKEFEKKGKMFKSQIETQEKEAQFKKTLIASMEENTQNFLKNIEILKGQNEEKTKLVETYANKIERLVSEKEEAHKQLDTQVQLLEKESRNHQQALQLVRQEAEIKQTQFVNQQRLEFESRLDEKNKAVVELSCENEKNLQEVANLRRQLELLRLTLEQEREEAKRSLVFSQQQAETTLHKTINSQRDQLDKRLQEHANTISNLRKDNERLTQLEGQSHHQVEELQLELRLEREKGQRIQQELEQQRLTNQTHTEKIHTNDSMLRERNLAITVLNKEKEQLISELMMAKMQLDTLQKELVQREVDSQRSPSVRRGAQSTAKAKVAPANASRTSAKPKDLPTDAPAAPTSTAKRRTTTASTPKQARNKSAAPPQPPRATSTDVEADNDESSEEYLTLGIKNVTKTVKRKSATEPANKHAKVEKLPKVILPS